MNDWFGEKSIQVEPHELTAFGIRISSRFGEASELIQLMRFAEECAKRKVDRYVNSAFYDSKASMCSFELDDAVNEGDAVAEAIYDAASKTIAQFYLFDIVGHCEEPYDEELTGTSE